MKTLLLALMLTTFNVHTDWKLENPNSWGSFYWKVNRSNSVDSEGKFWYRVYFYSNSLFDSKKNDGVNYDKASTYIKNIDMKMIIKDNYGTTINVVPIHLDFIVCGHNYDAEIYQAWFWSNSPNTEFTLTFGEAFPYDYDNGN